MNRSGIRENSERRGAKVQRPRREAPAALAMLAALLLCSCRSGTRATMPAPSMLGPDGLPPTAWTGGPPPGTEDGLPAAIVHAPVPYEPVNSWQPPGLQRPWPYDEYLRDGGDREGPVAVSPDWQVEGLDLEDTVAHYDALDGRTLVEASNRVHIYAPRFGAVRSVTTQLASEQIDQPIGVKLREQLVRHDDIEQATTSLQREQARGDVGTKIASAYRTRQGDGAVSNTLTSFSFQDAFLPFENLQVIKLGLYEQAEKARLAEATQAAVVWAGDQAVQVLLDRRAAVELAKDERTEAVYTDKDLREPRLRIIKVASTQTALPGETIDFTLRFDNIGTQPLGNIVIIDSLTTRLEYVAESAQSSLKAEFSSQQNEGESLVLRWEISNPLEPGEGGIVRFRCRVR
ncbi:MAG TPA: DUF11 domain-containing protein [Pirellulales bacterium]|nr:DUF11 domain-containing protein [Pirellulales bacterium]